MMEDDDKTRGSANFEQNRVRDDHVIKLTNIESQTTPNLTLAD
jgi:hypothetical protein